MLTAAGLTLLVNAGGAIFNWVYKSAGRVATQIFLFVLAGAAAAYWQYNGLVPGLAAWFAGAVSLFSLAVAFYEVLLSYFPIFSGPTA